MILGYVIGPFSAATPDEVEANIREAERLGRLIADMGVVPLVPHSIGRHMQSVRSYQWWMDATGEMLSRCDLAITAPGWHESRGSIVEVAQCEATGKPLFHSTRELARWLGGRRL